MIPAIGIMVGFYILTRSVSIASSSNESLGAKIFAWVTFFVTVICMLDLVLGGQRVSS